MCEVSNLIFMEGKNEGIAEGMAKGKAAGIAEGRAAGIAEGIAEGKAAGIAEGIAEGKAAGIAEGKAVGIAEGKVKGELDTKRASAVRMHAMGLQDSMIAASLDAAVEDVRVWISENSIPA